MELQKKPVYPNMVWIYWDWFISFNSSKLKNILTSHNIQEMTFIWLQNETLTQVRFFEIFCESKYFYVLIKTLRSIPNEVKKKLLNTGMLYKSNLIFGKMV